MTKDVQDLMNEVERVRDAFHRALWSDADPTAALGLARDDCELTITPAGTGAAGTDALRGFLVGLADTRPADLAFTRVTRTGDRWRVVDEETVTFTHDRELPWLAPGVAATHRTVAVGVISVVTVRRSRVTRYRSAWDQLGLLDQLGRLDTLTRSSATRP